jgi:hypothetical protein
MNLLGFVDEYLRRTEVWPRKLVNLFLYVAEKPLPSLTTLSSELENNHKFARQKAGQATHQTAAPCLKRNNSLPRK